MCKKCNKGIYPEHRKGVLKSDICTCISMGELYSAVPLESVLLSHKLGRCTEPFLVKSSRYENIQEYEQKIFIS